MSQDAAALYGRGLGFPPRVGTDGHVLWSVGETSVRESIRIVLMTEPEERLLLPGFGAGLRRFLFEPNTPATHLLIQERIQEALRRWEPRINVESVVVEPDQADPQAALATITYQLVATRQRERLSLSVGLGAA